MKSILPTTFFGVVLLLAPLTLQSAPPERGPSKDLKEASQQGDLAKLKAALNAGAQVDNPDRYGSTALMYAAEFGQLPAVTYLVETAKADVEKTARQTGETALTRAAYHGFLPIVTYLVGTAKANKNAKDYAGRTALYYANAQGHVDVANYLKSVGAV